MKKETNQIIYLECFYITFLLSILTGVAYCEDEKIDSSSTCYKEEKPWTNSIYLSSGYGKPQGFKYELGYNIGDVISLALTFGINDNWSRGSDEGTLGFVGKIHFYKVGSITPYFLFCRGGMLSDAGIRPPDAYTLFYIGSKISLSNFLQFCPEFGLVFLSKHISGGGDSGITPIVYENKTKLGINISFEIDFRQLF